MVAFGPEGMAVLQQFFQQQQAAAAAAATKQDEQAEQMRQQLAVLQQKLNEVVSSRGSRTSRYSESTSRRSIAHSTLRELPVEREADKINRLA
jgi:hypothetical protein